jgi:hypothetical protein
MRDGELPGQLMNLSEPVAAFCAVRNMPGEATLVGDSQHNASQFFVIQAIH